MQCGPVRFSMSAKAMAEMNPFEHRVVPCHTDFRMPPDLTEATIQDVYGALSNDALRNAMIADDIVRAIESAFSSASHWKDGASTVFRNKTQWRSPTRFCFEGRHGQEATPTDCGGHGGRKG
jgi:hypothetical protein